MVAKVAGFSPAKYVGADLSNPLFIFGAFVTSSSSERFVCQPEAARQRE